MKPARARRSIGAVCLAAAALAGALPAAPGCTVFAGWSDLQNGRASDAAAPSSNPTGTGTTTGTTTSPTTSSTEPPPDASTSPGDGGPPTNLAPCPPEDDGSCACSMGPCQADCVTKSACQFVVDNGGSMSVDCTAGKCTYWCLQGLCHGDCTGGGCTVHCRTSASCNFDCSGGGCVYLCEGGGCNFACSGGGCSHP